VNQIEQILERIKIMLLEMGFVETVVTNPYRSEMNYVYGNLYCIPQYIECLGFLIEYADSYEEAQNHGHEDGDALPLSMGVSVIITNLAKEVRQVLNTKLGYPHNLK
jgi:hypothetical protein